MLGLLIALLISGWAFYGLHVMGLNQAVLKDLSKPIAEWFDEPGNNVKVMLWFGVLLLNVVVFIWVKDPDSLLGDRRGEAIGIGITVIVIDELASYRSRLERKQEIIEQAESKVRDVAVEAIRLARKNGFLDVLIKKANLVGANLEGVDFEYATLKEADFRSANLKRANFHRAHLRKADLRGAYLRRAVLIGADLRGAEFRVAILKRTWMQKAKLQGANLSNVDLSTATLAGAVSDEDTVWPDGFDIQKAGVELRP